MKKLLLSALLTAMTMTVGAQQYNDEMSIYTNTGAELHLKLADVLDMQYKSQVQALTPILNNEIKEMQCAPIDFTQLGSDDNVMELFTVDVDDALRNPDYKWTYTIYGINGVCMFDDTEQNGYIRLSSGSLRMMENMLCDEFVTTQELVTSFTITDNNGITLRRSGKTIVNHDVDITKIFEACYTNLGFSNAKKDPNGGCDIPGWDSSITSIVRNLITLNCLPTDEMVCIWGDYGIYDLMTGNFNDRLPQIEGMYLRLQRGVKLCNDVIESSDAKPEMITEARFLRALYNYYLLDLFRNVPVNFSNEVENPQTIRGKEFFDYIVSELQSIVNELEPVGYSRASKPAAQLLLARLYLNAGVYRGENSNGSEFYMRAMEYAEQIINEGYYKLYSEEYGRGYEQLFLSDNDRANEEIIFAIPYHPLDGRDYNGTTFLIAATHHSDMDSCYETWYQYWAGYATTQQMLEKFFVNKDVPYCETGRMQIEAGDDRAMFYTQDRTYLYPQPYDFRSFASIDKFRARYSNKNQDLLSSQFADNDMPLMRYAEVLLTAAEAAFRLGDNAKALSYINQVRERAHATPLSTLREQDVIDEWAREFYSEGRRRTDLVRFGLFTSYQYLWYMKGGTNYGTSIDSYKDIFPIPLRVLEENVNSIQNPGY